MSRKVAMVTGAARGIGKAGALSLADRGFDVVLADVIDTTAAVGAVEALGRQALGVRCDVTRAADRTAALAEVRSRFGRLDVLVNNAGVAPRVRANILQASEESYDFVMNVNLKGPYFLTQAVANWMIEQRAQRPDDFLAIINISSISAETASPSRGEYCLSKAGVSMATKLWAAELAQHEIYVYEIRPGIIKTDMTAAVTEKYDRLIFEEGITPIRRWGTPEDVATAMATCATGGIPMATGVVIHIDGGFHLSIL
ncbi:MAG: 3-ketoacyl-ACP reductase [Lentisphaeria bacterium]|nr:3-ketoacyl-ACP reductase [Lentisphaeria bacterium]